MRGASYTGQTLAGRYSIGERLGEGAWGAVYAAVQTDLGRKVAIKILHTDVALAEEGIARFQREARAAAALGHPNIAQVTDFQSNPNEPPFLVMELLNGETLGAVLQREKRIPGVRVAAITHQILSALDTAHRAGIVHRDVKPDNVFLVSMPGIDDFVKLLDFGIAKLSADNHAQITDAGAMLGSPAFMAPEQVRNTGIDHRTDLYAVGATMYLALTGKFPFDQTSMHALLFAITEQKPTPMTTHDPTIDSRLVAIVERAMHKESAGRFFSAAEMRGALEPLLASTSRPGMVPHATFPSGQMQASATGGKNMTSVMSATAAPPTVAHASSPQPSIMGAPPPTIANPPSANPSIGGGQFSQGPPTAQASSAAHSPPIGTPPPGPPMPMHMMQTPGPGPGGTSPPAKGSGVVIGLLIGIVVLLLLIGGGVTIFFVVASKDDPKTTATTGSASVTRADTPPSASPTGATTTPAVNTSATAGATTKPKPGPTPTTTTTTTADAGVAPTPVVVDAGAPPVGKKQFAGSRASWSGGGFNNYDIEKTKEAFAKVNPAVNACFALSEFDPPDHQFTYWTFNADPAGNIIFVKRKTGADPHSKLDPCVIAALRQMKVQAIPGGGSFDLGLSSRTKDNP